MFDLCDKCGGETIRNDKYDAYYCPVCLEWSEPLCNDDLCVFCINRPETVAEALNEGEEK